METKKLEGCEIGEVTIKKFSVKDNLKLTGFQKKGIMTSEGFQLIDRDEVDTVGMTLYTLAAGVFSVKDKITGGEIISQKLTTEEKVRILQEYTEQEIQPIITAIAEFNKPKTEEQLKN